MERFEKESIMKKIIFLTLVMIFGMSSVSFGKSYLCISDVGVMFQKKNQVWETKKLSGNKYLLKTNQNEGLYHFSFFGSKSNFCFNNNTKEIKSFKHLKRGKIIDGFIFCLQLSWYLCISTIFSLNSK